MDLFGETHAFFSMEAPKTPPHQLHKELTRDDRIRVHTLHNIGLGYAKIASQLDFSYHQVLYAVLRLAISPEKQA